MVFLGTPLAQRWAVSQHLGPSFPDIGAAAPGSNPFPHLPMLSVW